MYGGVLAKVSILLSLFPAGFIALLPAAKYNLDKSLASLCWLMSYVVSFLAFIRSINSNAALAIPL